MNLQMNKYFSRKYEFFILTQQTVNINLCIFTQLPFRLISFKKKLTVFSFKHVFKFHTDYRIR